MPFKVTYNIYEQGKQAPSFTSHDRTLVNIEYAHMTGKQGMLVRVVPVVTPVEPLTKSEEYLFLVYDVRRLQRIYFNQGRRQDDLKASLDKEARLDRWNTATRHYFDTHPEKEAELANMPHSIDKKLHYCFFSIVEAWRKAWHEYMGYKKRKGKNIMIEKEMKQKCFDYEKAIDEYITKTIGI